jgi:hypothetical protein
VAANSDGSRKAATTQSRKNGRGISPCSLQRLCWWLGGFARNQLWPGVRLCGRSAVGVYWRGIGHRKARQFIPAIPCGWVKSVASISRI